MKLNVVPARTGILWVKLGIRTFFRQPLALSGLFFIYIATILVVSSLLPYVGPAIAGLLLPGATLGLIAATAEAANGRFPMPTVLVSAFRDRKKARAMLVLGAIYAAGSMLAAVLTSLVLGEPPTVPAVPSDAPDTWALVLLLFNLPLLVAFWYAPALVHWYGIEPVKSMFFSTVAVLRNFGAHLVYALAWLAVFVGWASIFGLIGQALGGAAMAKAMMVPVVLLMAAMFSSSIYFAFRDSFAPDPTPNNGEK